MQHELASRAVASVVKVLANTGAAVEEVKNDYGEDLFVQTSWRGEVDLSKIWIQVKSRERVAARPRNGHRSVKVSRDHALRWSTMGDTVVVVLWDVSRDIGWYVMPAQCLDAFEVLMSKDDFITLRVPDDNVFDELVVRRLTWRARMDHLNRRAAALHAQVQEGEDISGDEYLPFRQRQAHIGFEAVRFVGIMDEGGYTKAFDERLRNAYKNISRADVEGEYSVEENFDQAVMLLTMATVEEAAEGEALPWPLLGLVSGMIGAWYKGVYGSVEKWDSSDFPPDGY
ncbi:DUF4365 domain-containing protein [Micromonospora sp. NPDC018662]|uniref:DUF4365 domain-containing protein n=1 Tax=Micromonospora sp. NPDC018662 TaxID=3364238 RepID=UPI0037A8DCEE